MNYNEIFNSFYYGFGLLNIKTHIMAAQLHNLNINSDGKGDVEKEKGPCSSP